MLAGGKRSQFALGQSWRPTSERSRAPLPGPRAAPCWIATGAQRKKSHPVIDFPDVHGFSYIFLRPSWILTDVLNLFSWTFLDLSKVVMGKCSLRAFSGKSKTYVKLQNRIFFGGFPEFCRHFVENRISGGNLHDTYRTTMISGNLPRVFISSA